MDFANVTAVIPTWKTTDQVLELLGTLQPAFASGMRMVLVENGSGEEAVRRIQSALLESSTPRAVTFIASPRNVGFMNAVNLAVETALNDDHPPEAIWLINPDSAVRAETLEELVDVWKASGAGIVSAPEGGPGIAGQGRWPRPFWARPSDYMLTAPGNARWAALGRCACWCSLFDSSLVRDLVRKDGHFLDGSIFLDWDEWDVSLRAVKTGYQVVAALECGADHVSTHSYGQRPIAKARQYYQARNSLVVGRRHMSALQFWSLLPLHFARDASWLLRLRLQGKHPHERSYVRGAVDAFRGRLGRWEHHPD